MTAILGTAQTTSAAASAWAAKNGAAPWFCQLAAVYWQLAPGRGGVRPDVAWCDFAKETGFGRFGGTDPAFSASHAMHNPCGLKTADGTKTATFPDWWQGITAHLDHLALYAGAPGYPRAASPDPRAFPYLHGVCPTVESLGGHWSPSADYGTTLVADYLTPLLAHTGAAVTTTACPFARQEPIANNTGGPMAANLGLVVHEAEGDGDLHGWFDNPAAQVSAHFWIGKDGTLCQYVPVGVVAWAEMAGNDSYISVETEGYATEAFTGQQCQTLARLIAWGHQTYGWPLQLVDHGASGITTHCHYPSGVPDPDWGGHPCPGSIRSGQLPAIVAAAQLIVNPKETPNVPQLAAPVIGGVVRPQEDGYWLIGQDGGIFNFGAAPQFTDPEVGKLQPGHFVRNAVATKSGNGLWLFASDGGVLCFGDAHFYGSIPGLKVGPSTNPLAA